jgi:molybdopterin-binding protein
LLDRPDHPNSRWEWETVVALLGKPRQAKLRPPCLAEGSHPREVGYNPAMRLSARNHLIGKITELELGDIMAHVVVQVGDNMVESIITRRSAEEMSLKVGDTVAAVIKSTEVMLQKA